MELAMRFYVGQNAVRLAGLSSGRGNGGNPARQLFRQHLHYPGNRGLEGEAHKP
jgi:hypothetical protein